MDEAQILKPPLGAPDCYSNPNIPKIRSAAWFAQLEKRKRQSDFEQGYYFRYREDTFRTLGQTSLDLAA